jgi:hypothetical protein
MVARNNAHGTVTLALRHSRRVDVRDALLGGERRPGPRLLKRENRATFSPAWCGDATDLAAVTQTAPSRWPAGDAETRHGRPWDATITCPGWPLEMPRLPQRGAPEGAAAWSSLVKAEASGTLR